jgi:hypothetical protein
MAIPLLSGATPSKRLLAYKADDAAFSRKWLVDRRIKALDRATPHRLSARPARLRHSNVINASSGVAQTWRRIAIRHDRHASNYPAAISLNTRAIASSRNCIQSLDNPVSGTSSSACRKRAAHLIQ